LQSRIAARSLLIPSLRYAKLGVARADTASPTASAVRNLLILVMIGLLIFLSRIISVAGSRET
jgi:sorbitol-specific phosphotransferase system component IIBC